MTEDERHDIAMRELDRRLKEATYAPQFSKVLFDVIRMERAAEIGRHFAAKRRIQDASPAPRFNYRHC